MSTHHVRRDRRTGIRSGYFCLIRSASALRFSNSDWLTDPEIWEGNTNQRGAHPWTWTSLCCMITWLEEDVDRGQAGVTWQNIRQHSPILVEVGSLHGGPTVSAQFTGNLVRVDIARREILCFGTFYSMLSFFSSLKLFCISPRLYVSHILQTIVLRNQIKARLRSSPMNVAYRTLEGMTMCAEFIRSSWASRVGRLYHGTFSLLNGISLWLESNVSIIITKTRTTSSLADSALGGSIWSKVA